MNDPLPSPSSSSSTSHASEDPLDYAARLEQAHSAFASLPEELCVVSFTSSPRRDLRTGKLSEAITDALNAAGGDPTHPKWGHVTRLVKLGCTSRGSYVGAEAGIRVGDTTKVNVRDVQWTLPETEEEWWDYERKWGHKFHRGVVEKGTVSKYWARPLGELLEQGSAEPVQRAGTKFDLVQEKVATWQAAIAPAETESQLSKNTAKSQTPQNTAKGKGKAKRDDAIGSQSSLGFSVVKRSGVTNGKVEKTHGAVSQHDRSVPRRAASPDDIRMSSPAPKRPSSIAPEEPHQPPSTSEMNHGVDYLGIAEMSEMSFLPPSFPSQLETSTPHSSDKAKSSGARRKPSPIPLIPLRSYPSSPLSSPPPTQQMLPAGHLQPSSSEPMLSPTRRPTKRSRSNTPPPNDAMDTSSHGLSYMTPPSKKARVAPATDSSAPPPPSTPPPPASSALNASPYPPSSGSKGLGNAKGLPLPTTPQRTALPTLTDLLASSRRSKPRPRPPSRKATTSKQVPQSKDNMKDPEPRAPVLPRPDEGEDRPSSPARTYLSSPASGSSDSSPRSLRFRPRSPVSPLFSQNPATFAPAFVSSQPPGTRGGAFLGVGSYEIMQGGGPLARGSSGFFGMGYNSQFDVEGQVDRVSELLDRDVDYDGWLRDVPEVEEEGCLTQSQNKLTV